MCICSRVNDPGAGARKFWILCRGILNYTDLAIRWDPVQFERSRHHQGYVESDGSICTPLPISSPTQSSNLLASGVT